MEVIKSGIGQGKKYKSADEDKLSVKIFGKQTWNSYGKKCYEYTYLFESRQKNITSGRRSLKKWKDNRPVDKITQNV